MNNYRKAVSLAAVTVAAVWTLGAAVSSAAWPGSGKETTVAAFCKNDGQGSIITFSQKDFTDRVDGDEQLSAIVVQELPQGGRLRLAGLDVRAGEAVEIERAGALCFVPDIGVDVHTSFSFLPVFSRSGAGAQAVTVNLNISDRPNAAPIARTAVFETYSDLALYGALKAVDADGDPCTFTVEQQGKRGSVEILGDRFCYTPNGKSGEDSFAVIAVDCYGNRSQATEVTVKVVKRHARESFTYTDMMQNSAHYAALRLRDAGVFSGESFGSEAFFAPEQQVTRAQFMTMAAVVGELAMPTAAVSTGLSDNDSIPVWAQGYVAAGILSGVVKGSDDGSGNRVFGADRPITRAEAAAILDRCLGLSDDGREMAFADRDNVPAWAAQSVVNTAAAGLLPVFSDNTVRPMDAVTREDAAVMLYEMLKHTEN